MSSYTTTLIQKFALSGALVDTNLLLLYAVGDYDSSIVERIAFDRIAAYELTDLYLLRNLLSLFRKRVTTPHVLSEVSNWIGYLPWQQKVACLAKFQQTFSGFEELSIDSLQTSKHERFRFLGLTDTALAERASEYLVISDDAALIAHLNQMGLEGLNTNHLRQELWLRE